MKQFTLETITLEVSPFEALKLREALEWYRDTRLPSYNLYSQNPENEELCNTCFNMSVSEKNASYRKEEDQRIDDMMHVLWEAYTGYPFKR